MSKYRSWYHQGRRRVFLALVGLAASHLPAAADLRPALAKPILEPELPEVEVKVFTATRVAALPPVARPELWTQEADRLRQRLLDDVILRGEARRWRDAATRIEWLDVIETNHGYRIRKLRYEAIPGFWLAALLYEPSKLTGKVPVVVNLNGHERAGKSVPYIQERCINLAKRGLLALNPEWIGRGQQFHAVDSHYRLTQLDLCGTSGISLFYFAAKRALDIALALEHADPERLGVTGLSGGGWQTIFISALDPRVRLAAPVAGFSSYVTRAQFPALDLGDPEQTPSDLASLADYTHLVAMMAPRPTLLSYNAKDDCCFRADNSLAPLVQASRPFFRLFQAADKLRHHVNYDPGHNYGPDNREAFYQIVRDAFYGGSGDFAIEDIPSRDEIRTAEQLDVPLPATNANIHTLALDLSANLPRAGPADRARLRQIVKAPRYQITAKKVESAREDAIEIVRWRLRMDNDWTVPVVELSPAAPKSTVVIVADAGRASAAAPIQGLLAAGHRVVALDPYYFGESQLAQRAGLFAILIAAVGERPLGIQAGQLAATARWLNTRGLGPIRVMSIGPRSSLFALVAAALEPDAIASLEQEGAMPTLREIITQDIPVDRRPEQFCFGLLEEFDLPQIAALMNRLPMTKR